MNEYGINKRTIGRELLMEDVNVENYNLNTEVLEVIVIALKLIVRSLDGNIMLIQKAKRYR